MSNSGYRYGFNGKEKDNEVKGEGNSLNFGARIYDSRLGRWLSIDPLFQDYPSYSQYNFALNTPIQAIDPDGRLVIFVNGFMLDQYLTQNNDPNKLIFDGAHVQSPYRPYPTFEMNAKGPTYLGEKFSYWDGTDEMFTNRFVDPNTMYVNGSNGRTSSASERYQAGQASGQELIQQIQSGAIKLEKDETIKIVGHSQGAAHAAGMAQVLNEAYKNGIISNPVEQIYYLAPHQPQDINSPEGVFSVQYSRESDKVSTTGWKSKKLASGGSKFGRIKNVKEQPQMPNMDDERGGHNVSTFKQIFSIFKKEDEGYVRPKANE